MKKIIFILYLISCAITGWNIGCMNMNVYIKIILIIICAFISLLIGNMIEEEFK